MLNSIPRASVVGSANTRRVEPRNTPSVINAVFNHRQFWDGRAENVFNGVNHLGQRDPDARVFRADDPKNPVEVRVELVNASLASQAVAPIVSDLEMAAPGRTRLDVGRELARGKRNQGKKVAKAPSAGQAAGLADRQRARLDEPLAAERPLVQPIRPDDQGGVPREVVEVDRS